MFKVTGHEYRHIMEHFRAVVGFPLGDPSMKWPTSCNNILGEDVGICFFNE